MTGNFFGSFVKPYSYVKTALATFWATYVKIWLLVTPTSVHIGHGGFIVVDMKNPEMDDSIGF